MQKPMNLATVYEMRMGMYLIPTPGPPRVSVASTIIQTLMKEKRPLL
jgi:hypothetical protein